MLTGKVPFDGDNPISIALMHINDPMPSVSSQVPGIPPQLEKVIEKATDKYQSNRYKTADEMIEDLDNIDFITKVMGSSIFESQLEKKDEDISDAIKEAEDVKKREDEKKPVNKTKLFIIIASVIIVIAGIIGAGAMLGWFSGDNDEVEVPDFKGMTLEEANRIPHQKGNIVYSKLKQKNTD